MKTKIHDAAFADTPRILALIEQAHGRSKFADIVKVNRKEAKELLVGIIGKHGGAEIGSTFIQVATTGPRLDGVIIGLVQPWYWVTDGAEVHDLLFYVRPGADERVAMRLLRRLHAWAATIPNLVSVTMSANDAISPGAEVLYARAGMRSIGSIYAKEIGK